MKNEVDSLKSELSLLKLQFNERIEQVESRLEHLLAEQPEISKASIPSALKQEPIAVSENTQAEVDTSEKRKTRTQPTAQANAPHPSNPVVPVVPEFISAFIKSILLTVLSIFSLNKTTSKQGTAQDNTDQGNVIGQTVLSALFDWFSPVTKIYRSYQARGMLSVFFLTLTGIALTLAGFGYLMQLLIDQLGTGYRSLMMCTAAIAVTAIGVGLHIKTKFTEFATAIVALGILLGYSTVYFTGSVYGLIPNAIVLTLYLAIALICHFFAHWLNTKIISGLGIIGIATMPILSKTIEFDPLYYLLSLAFVALSSLILSYKKNMPWLAHLSLAFCIVALEWTVGVENLAISVWLLNAFYLIFFVYISLFLYKNEADIHQPLLLFAALIGSTVMLFFQATSLDTLQVSINFGLNSLLALAVSIFFYKIKHAATHLTVLAATLWLVLAVISAIAQAYWGIAWAIEGLILIYIAKRAALAQVINQGQILISLALIYCFSALLPYFPLPALSSIDGWLLSLLIALSIGLWLRLINEKALFGQFTQQKIKPFLRLIEVIWLSTLAIATSSMLLGNWTGVLVIIIQTAILFRAKQCNQKSIEIFAALLILVPISFVISGVDISSSYRFTQLPLFAKLAAASVFLQCWLWSEFYRRFYPSSTLKPLAEAVRIFFYTMLPIFWLSSVVRRFDEHAAIIAWLSPAIALFLAATIKHRLLLTEAKILTVLAAIAFIALAPLFSPLFSTLTLLGFITFFAATWWYHQRLSSSEEEQPQQLALSRFICTFGLLSLGIALPSIIGVHSNHLPVGLVFAACYWIGALTFINRSIHLELNKFIIVIANGLLVVSAWAYTFNNPLYAVIPLMFITSIARRHQVISSYFSIDDKLRENRDIALHLIAVITYSCLLLSLGEYRLDLVLAPALAVHGALVLFLKTRRAMTIKFSFTLISLGIIKLALVDAANAILWQKVILFIGIGVFILAATFWYQKLVKNEEVDQLEMPD